jgi:small-conductance mechanosensitive channel
MFDGVLQRVYWSNTLEEYLIAGSVFIGLVIALKVARHIIRKHLLRLAAKTSTTLDDFMLSIIHKIMLPLGYYGGFYAAARTLTLNPVFERAITVTGIALITFFIARFFSMLAEYGFEVYWIKRDRDVTLKHSLHAILRVSKVLIWAIAILLFLDNRGFKVKTILAGLGIGGIAFGLAAQAVLKDLFSYFSIIFDRPFAIGDFIIVGDYMGVVEYIGAKTTRIRSLSGEQLVFSNTDLTDSRVRNYKQMEKRRVAFKLGVTYQTTAKQLEAIPDIIEKIIRNVEDTVFDRAHFFSYGDFALVMEVVYYVLGADYNKYMNIQQRINLQIKEAFEKEGIEFAYPTQTLFLQESTGLKRPKAPHGSV